MTEVAGLPHWEVVFDQRGRLIENSGLLASVEAGGIRELFVLCHGWNSSIQSARELGVDLLTILSRLLRRFAPTRSGGIGLVSVLWPSLLFPEDEPAPQGFLRTPATGRQLADALAPAFHGQEAVLFDIGELLDQAPESPYQLEEAHRLINTLMMTPEPDAPEDVRMSAVTTSDTSVVFAYLGSLAADNTDSTSRISIFPKLWQGAREAFRVVTYYEMMNRAALIGQSGLGALIGELQRATTGVRVHLIGHSFGARLAAYSLPGLPAIDGASSPVKSLLLIQGAFSHFAFADEVPGQARPGHLAPYRNRVDGPLLATFSRADLALGRWYPAVSVIGEAEEESAHDLIDRFGAIGYDGFRQPDVEIRELGPSGTLYGFQSNRIYGLRSDRVIATPLSSMAGAHCDIRHEEVIWPVVCAALGDSADSE